jgi:hypothetical protein
MSHVPVAARTFVAVLRGLSPSFDTGRVAEANWLRISDERQYD